MAKDYKKRKLCFSGIGGQAVLEGIMMKNKDMYSVAVRTSTGEIDVETAVYHGVLHGSTITKIPFLRGVFNFLDSLILGLKTINYSASFFEEDPKAATDMDKKLNNKFGSKAEKIYTVFTVLISLLMAIGLFTLLPYFLSRLLEKYVRNTSMLTIIEGLIRLLIFVLYVWAIAAMKDIKRLYMYHGAEHKCISCIERGLPLNRDNVRKSSRYHNRCGTSFLLIVMVVSVVVFLFIRVPSPALKLLLRVLLLPVIAGISYELIRFTGRFDNFFTRLLAAPGAALQRITTSEPEDEMIDVAIKAVEAVFDWRAFQQENFDSGN